MKASNQILRLVAALGIAAIGVAGSAQAARVVGEGAAAPGQRTAVAAPVTPAASPGIELVSGVIEAVDPGRRTLKLNGKPVALHATTLKVLDPGGHSGSDMSGLRAGMPIRFALEPGDAPDRKIVLIYIDRQP